MDRCVCGGVRHWHAREPYGCDDCDCKQFSLDSEATRNARVQFRAVTGETHGVHVTVVIFAGPEGRGVNVGSLTMLEGEARDFCEMIAQAHEKVGTVGSATL